MLGSATGACEVILVLIQQLLMTIYCLISSSCMTSMHHLQHQRQRQLLVAAVYPLVQLCAQLHLLLSSTVCASPDAPQHTLTTARRR